MDNKIAKKAAKAFFNRSDFGMSTLLPGLGDTVKIDIAAEASKA